MVLPAVRTIEAFVLVRVQPVRLNEVSTVMSTIKEDISRIEGVKEVKGEHRSRLPRNHAVEYDGMLYPTDEMNRQI